MSYTTPIEETRYRLVTDKGPIDDRVFETYEQAWAAREALLTEGVEISTTTVRKQLLTE